MASQCVYIPSQQSLFHRAQIARTISPLRRLTPRVPFWKLAAHRIPTLWTLYRGLLRNAPSDIIKQNIAWEFSRHRHLTSPVTTKEKLLKAHRWKDIFVKAKGGDIRLQAILRRYTSMLEAKRDKDLWAAAIRKELHEIRSKSRPTGAFFAPTLYNRPLPMLKPQPINLTGIINRRRRSRVIRQQHLDNIVELHEALTKECVFESMVERYEGAQITKVMTHSVGQMSQHLEKKKDIIYGTFERDAQRIQMPYTPKIIDQVLEARWFKSQNKRWERLREERGEVLPKTIRRARKRPPPHILAKMTEQHKRWDAIARSSVSEVGYVGYAKAKLGWKLRNPNPWHVESGDPKNIPALLELEAQIVRENERRREKHSKEEVSTAGGLEDET